MQPTVWPWLGYFDLMDQVDVFVLYDDVQLSRQSWMTRNRILTAQGPVWLPVPVKQHGLDTLIVQAEIDDTRPWRRSSARPYRWPMAGPYFEPVYAVVESLIQQPTTSLAEFNVGLITHIAGAWALKRNCFARRPRRSRRPEGRTGGIGAASRWGPNVRFGPGRRPTLKPTPTTRTGRHELRPVVSSCCTISIIIRLSSGGVDRIRAVHRRTRCHV
ncbi:MAG: WbqC family protein [Vampirovibrionales bacterium]